MKYKREPRTSIEDFIIAFRLKVNKVKASGTELSEGVLGYTLLNCANLSEEKHGIIKATCSELTYKVVKTQLVKVGIKTSNADKFQYSAVPDAGSSKVKVESCFYEDSHPHNCSGNSSDEDLNGEQRIYYGSKRSSYDNQQSNKGCKLNLTDRFGHVRSCTFCKCVYHWLVDCPYAPQSVKTSFTSRGSRNNSHNKPSSATKC